MILSDQAKESLKRDIVASLAGAREVRKIVIFGSFAKSEDPHDIDVAVFQDSSEGYLELALKYRRMTRQVARRIPVDILPISPNAQPDAVMMKQILGGVTVYEG
jgi:predicted nucleotidyltransferase